MHSPDHADVTGTISVPSTISGQARRRLPGLTSCGHPLLQLTGRQELEEVLGTQKLKEAHHPPPGRVWDHVWRGGGIQSTWYVK